MRARITPITTIFEDFRGWQVRYSLDDRYIICSGMGGNRIWDTVSKREVSHSLPAGHFAFSPDGRAIAIAPYETSKILFFSMQSFEQIGEFSTAKWGRGWDLGGHNSPHIISFDFSQNSDNFVLARSDAKLTTLSFPSMQELSTITVYNDDDVYNLNMGVKDFIWGMPKITMGFDVARVPQTQIFAVCASPEISFWNTQYGNNAGRISKPAPENSYGASFNFIRFQFSSDGRYMATGYDYAPVMLWDVTQIHYNQKPKWRTSGVSFGYIQALAFSHDERVLVSAGRGGVINVLDMANGSILAEIQNTSTSKYGGSFGGNEEIFDIDMSRAGVLVTCDRGDKIKLWQVQY